MKRSALLETLAAAARGEAPAWPFGTEPGAAQAFLDAAREHGMHVLVAARLGEASAAANWPPGLRAALAGDLREAAIVEEVRRAELMRLLGAMASRHLFVLLIKGTPLAYTNYAKPWLRPRVDTDWLVGEADIGEVTSQLEACGYVRSPLVDGSLVMRQAEYVRADRAGVQHAIDVHWKLGNPHVLADLLSVEELRARAVAVPGLGDAALAPCAEHALLVAAAHRVLHHASRPRLIWLHDIHLLAGAMTAEALAEFGRLAVGRRVARVCQYELAAARAAFGTRLATDPRELGALFDGADPGEPSARYLDPARRPAARLLTDLNLTPRWRDRARLLAQHLFPSPAYMRTAYGRPGHAVLPLLYAHRVLTGVWSWLRRPAA